MRRDGTSSRATPPPPRVDARGSRPRHRIKGDPNVGSEQRTRETGAGDAPGRAERARGDAGGERRGAAGDAGPRGAARAMAVQLERARIVVVGRECVTRCQPTRTARTRLVRIAARRFTSSAISPQPLLGPSRVSQPDRGLTSSHGDRDALFVSTGNITYLWTICTCVKNRQRANPVVSPLVEANSS